MVFHISAYRQSIVKKKGSGIVALSHDIRNHHYDSRVFQNYRDFHFTVCPNKDVAQCVQAIVKKAVEEGYDASDVQVLAPMYRGYSRYRCFK